jgi:hypothetical protein
MTLVLAAGCDEDQKNIIASAAQLDCETPCRISRLEINWEEVQVKSWCVRACSIFIYLGILLVYLDRYIISCWMSNFDSGEREIFPQTLNTHTHAKQLIEN